MIRLWCLAAWLFQASLTQKARIAIAANHYDEAQRALEAAIAEDPKQPEPRFLLGFLFYLKNDFERARAELLRADPKNWRVAFYLALTEEALNHTEAAGAYYERALQLDA